MCHYFYRLEPKKEQEFFLKNQIKNRPDLKKVMSFKKRREWLDDKPGIDKLGDNHQYQINKGTSTADLIILTFNYINLSLKLNKLNQQCFQTGIHSKLY